MRGVMLLLRSLLGRHRKEWGGGILLNPEERSTWTMSEEKYIQLIANYDDWVAIKKLKIDETMDPRTVMEFLAGLNTSLDNKVEGNLKKCVPRLAELDAALETISVGKKESDMASMLAETASGKVNKVVNEICESDALQAGEIKELKGFCKAYAMRKMLKKAGLAIDYSQIDIPGMKRVMKKKT